MSIILNGARLAARWHKNQKRDDTGAPYMTHLIRVAGRVMTLDEMEECDGAAAYLHDSLEDQAENFGGSIQMQEEIRRECGQDTLVIVLGLTNPSKGMELPRVERKHIDREHLRRCPQRVKRIKLVDRIDNLQEILHDLRHGLSKRHKFAAMYAGESELLLKESLTGADSTLEQELAQTIADLRAIC